MNKGIKTLADFGLPMPASLIRGFPRAKEKFETGRVMNSRNVLRPVLVSLSAVAVVACAMTINGWNTTSLLLGLLITVIAGWMVYQIHWAIAHLHKKSESVEKASFEAENHYIDVIRRIIHYIEARSEYSQGHSKRVAELSEKIARQIGLEEARCQLMNLAGQIHDVGMLAVSDHLLVTRGKLGANEFRTIKKHPSIAHELLSPLKTLESILPAVKHHHERMNGTGYPDGISGEDIPIEARILAVADTYEAMTHDRPQRTAMTSIDAMMELNRCAPAGYDPGCVEALADILNMKDLIKNPSENYSSEECKVCC